MDKKHMHNAVRLRGPLPATKNIIMNIYKMHGISSMLKETDFLNIYVKLWDRFHHPLELTMHPSYNVPKSVSTQLGTYFNIG